MKIIVYPQGENPYQELLYNPLRNKGHDVHYYNAKIFGKHNLPLFFPLIVYRIKGYNIFHLHWISPFVFPKKNRFFETIMLCYLILFIGFLKLIRYRVIWTLHNIYPHDRNYKFYLTAEKIVSNLCDAKIVHSKNTIKDMQKFGFNIRDTYTISIGNYIGVYDNNVKESIARRYFNLKKNDFVFLFFGRIEPYKGIENLLEAFKKIEKKRKHIKLLIAGKCDDKNLIKMLDDYGNKFKENTRIDTNFIEDDKVQYYFNSTNVVVYPFKKITTSSTVILAFSFRKPVICPEIGDLKQFPDNIGIFYNPKNKNGLLTCMEKAIAEKFELSKLGKRAFEYAESLDWNRIAEKTIRVYNEVLK